MHVSMWIMAELWGLFSLTQNASDMVSTNFLLPVQASAEPSYVLLSPISLAGTGYLC